MRKFCFKLKEKIAANLLTIFCLEFLLRISQSCVVFVLFKLQGTVYLFCEEVFFFFPQGIVIKVKSFIVKYDIFLFTFF